MAIDSGVYLQIPILNNYGKYEVYHITYSVKYSKKSRQD